MSSRKCIFLLLLFFCWLNTWARQLPPVTFPMPGTTLMAYANNPIYFSATLPNIVLSQLNTPNKSTAYQNTVVLSLKNNAAFNENARVTVTATLKHYSINGGLPVVNNITLQIDYKAGALAKSNISNLYAFKNAYKVELTITNVTVTSDPGVNLNALKQKLADFIELTIGFQEERVTRISYNSFPTGLDACENPATDELVISWNGMDDAESYELEYSFVDDYGDTYSTAINPANLSYNFKDNSTRIALKETMYRFPLVYERGFILYRVRAIGRGGAGLAQPVYCTWSGAERGMVSAFPNRYYHANAHVADKINWQVVSTFAEEGKRSDMVNYFDGTLRSRQTGTAMNLERQLPRSQINLLQDWLGTLNCPLDLGKEREVIAGETIYDYQGRPAVNILPTPTNSKKLTYLPNLNISNNINAPNTTRRPYNWQDFDRPSYTCPATNSLYPQPDANTGIMGAAAYYSPNNPNKLGFNAFIPESDGYPFTQISYLQDNTGRVAAQTGVGPLFQFGKGHETRFYYAAPNQEELDQMFGTEVGDAIRYQKNAVMDANGQVSVSYINPEGKVIATALAGSTPANLNALSNQNSNLIDISLMSKNVVSTDDKTLITEHEFVVTSDNTNYVFDYSIDPGKLQYILCDGAAVCLDCIYDIDITLNNTKGCTGTPIFSYTGTIGDLLDNHDNVDLTCSNGTNTGSYPRQVVKTLDIGTYVITKKVTVNQQAAQAYIAAVFKDTCKAKWDELLADELSHMDTTSCYRSCDACAQPPVSAPACDTAYCKPNPNRCQIIRSMMLADVSPGGQYAQFVRNPDGSIDASAYPLSVFNPGNQLPNPVINLGLFPSSITSYSDLVNHWLPEYAEKLLPMHPEACLLNWCSNGPLIDTTLDFDVELLSTQFFTDAVAAGYITTGSPLPTVNTRPYQQLLDSDPWFLGGQNPGERAMLLYKLEHYGCSAPGLPADELAMQMAYCASVNPVPQMPSGSTPAMNPNGTPCTVPPNYFSTHGFGTDPVLADKEWTFLRALYLSAKIEVIQKSMNDFADNHSCNSRCIGAKDYFDWAQFSWPFPNFASLHNHKPCHFPSPFSWILYADKQSRFSTGIDNILNVMEGAGISISTGGVTNFDDPCQYAQAIISQAGSINSQVANAACGGTVAPPRPCPVIDGLTAALNNVIHNLKNAGSFTLTGAQVPISVRNAGIPQVGGIRLKDGSISIATIPCMDSLYLPSLSTPSGSLMPSSVCCIRNISCPQNTNCSFDIQISYSNGATRTLRVVTKCDFLSGCGETAVHACSQPTAYMAPVKDYLNDVFNFSTANNSLPSAGQLTGLLPAIFRGDQSWHIQNTALAASGNFVVNLTYNNPEGQSKSCNITLQNNTAIGNWSNVKHVISIAPDMTVATSGITNGFILKVLSGSSVNSLATVTIRGSSSCWPMNQCSPEVTLCDSFQAMPPYPQVNNCVQGLLATANSNASIRYNAWRDSMVADLLKQYNARCLEAIETFNMKYTDRQYHYTLYYYDQAGNLVKTVPPAGVKLLSHTEALQVAASRLTAYLPAVLPQHFKHTVYRYNTLNELVWQKTPDAGESNFYYDKLGRIGASQNAQQKLTNLFSYTKYDPLGRPVEAGKFPSTALAVKTNLAAGNLAAWTNFINGRPGRTEIILTQYDQSYTPAVSQKFGTAGQRNLRKRIASVFNFSSVPHLLLRKYIHATHYSYDIEGNVSKLIQDYPNGIIKDKTIDYDYDLQSGKVNQVTYQAGFTDQFIHRYSYDAANRLTQVKTSTDGLIWETDAEYKYYRHGPLARTELGTDKVQGLDYMYTLQGWIKAVNGTTSTAATDMGQDGIVNPVPGTPQVQIRTITINGITVYVYITPLILGSNFNGPGYGAMHNPVARDAFGYVLEYYNNDYSAIQGNSCLNDMQQQTGVVRPLYNGNISRMYTQIQSLGNNGYNYIYDQLNRIASAHAWNINSSGAMSLLANNAYSNSFTYDADGNIMGQQRNGTTSVPAMDKMTYMYYDAANGTYDPAIAIPANATNRLAYVKDGIPAGNYTEDIDNQNPNNYRYDLIGNLVRDNAEHISQISWNLQNKIVRIIKSTGPSLSFEYDAFGNRVMKQVTGGTPAQNTKTFYVRDAQGNTMAVYTYNIPPAGSSKLYWGEAHIYGSSRLGMYTPAKLIPVGNTPASGPYYIASRGYKQYELSNHLGNVLATISDRKIPVAGSAALIYTADLLSGSDYYVFGMGMVGRSLPNGNYRFDFNGKEKDDEIKGIGNSLDFKARIYDPRLGKFLSTDPSFRRYPSWSPYLFAGNSPIRFIDILGKGPGDVVVAFGGADIFGIGDKGRAPILISIIEKAILNKEGGKAQSFVSSYISTDLNCTQSLDIATQAAYDFVKENYNKVNGKDVEGGKVVIEGYSFGGVLANHLTSRLVTDGIKVDFLVTVDAAAGFQTNQVVRVVESEVNLNVFQRNASSVRSHGEPNVGLTEKNKVFNVDATSGTQHGDIDDKAEIGVATQIIKNLKRPEEKSKPSGPKRRISQN